jgi:hypothetical protein
MKSDVPPMLVMQRIRNRIYEYVESVVEYTRNQGQSDLNEVINEWEMYVDDPFERGAFPGSAFVRAEVDAIAEVHAVWLAFADATPQSISDAARAMATLQWRTLVEACHRAALAFAARGKLPEDVLLVHEV